MLFDAICANTAELKNENDEKLQKTLVGLNSQTN